MMCCCEDVNCCPDGEDVENDMGEQCGEAAQQASEETINNAPPR